MVGKRMLTRRPMLLLIAAVAALALLVVMTPLTAGALDRPNTWVDGELFAGVVTPATFDPANGNFDELYHGFVGQDGDMQGGGFSMGVPLISESKPGDQDYNGGRWHLNILKSGVPAGKYAGATGVGDLDLADFVPTGMYFECPLLPRRGNGPPS